MGELSRSYYEVAVVGAGPAGSSAAFALAAEGFDVVLIEKALLPRYKTCGGGIVRRANQLMPIDIRQIIECECYTAQVNILDADLQFNVRKREPLISMIMREQFDFLLVSAARSAGAFVRQGCEVLGLACGADWVELSTTQGAVRAGYVIAADGAASPIARKLRLRKPGGVFLTLEYEVFVPREELSRFTGIARFDIGLVPQGYAWVFPKRNHLSIGIGSMRWGAAHLGRSLEHYLRIIGLNHIERIERHGFFIPVNPRDLNFAKGRILLAGDAAGLADPFTGEGITSAILSGQMAARALIDGNFDEHRVGKFYERAIRERILSELRLAGMLAKLIYQPKIRNPFFRYFGEGFINAVMDVFVGTRTYRQLLLSILYGRSLACG